MAHQLSSDFLSFFVLIVYEWGRGWGVLVHFKSGHKTGRDKKEKMKGDVSKTEN